MCNENLNLKALCEECGVLYFKFLLPENLDLPYSPLK
jgi:hypothetical protein